MRKLPVFCLSSILAGAFALAFTAAPLLAARQTPPAQVPMPGGRGAPPQAPPQKGEGFILGEVVDAGTGRPLADAIVTVNLRGGRGGGPNMEALSALGGNSAAMEMAMMAARGGAAPGQTRLMTGPDGRFVFRDLPKGPVNIQATLSGYVPGAPYQARPNGPSRPIELEDGERLADVRIALWKYGVITGTLVDEAGEPAVGVQMRASRRSFQQGRSRFSNAATGKTDDRGHYRLTGLLPGDYIVSQPQTPVTMPVATVDAMLGAMSSMMPGLNSLAELGPQAAMTEQGGIRVGDLMLASNAGTSFLPPVNGRIVGYQTMFHPGLTTASQAAVIRVGSGEERAGIDLQLRLTETVHVAGKLSTATGPVGANIQVYLRRAGEDGSGEAVFEAPNTMTLKDGSFTFLGIAPGQYVLVAVRQPRPEMPPGMPMMPFMDAMMPDGPTGGQPTFANVPVAVTGDVTDLAVVLTEGRKVTGRIAFDGTPPAAAQIKQINVGLPPADNAIGAMGVPRGGRGTVQEDGQFALTGVQPGKYSVTATIGRGGGPGAAPWRVKSVLAAGREVAEEPVEIQDADVADVLITMTSAAASQLAGTVRRSGASTESVLATVFVFPEDTEAWIKNGMSARRMRSAQATKTGSYTIPGLTAGGYLIAAIEDAEVGDPQDPAFFQALARIASKVVVEDGDKKTMDLTMSRVGR